MRDEAGPSGLALSRYDGQELTPEEINLKKYFEVKEQEKRRLEDLQKQQKEKRMQQMQCIKSPPSFTLQTDAAPATSAP